MWSLEGSMKLHKYITILYLQKQVTKTLQSDGKRGCFYKQLLQVSWERGGTQVQKTSALPPHPLSWLFMHALIYRCPIFCTEKSHAPSHSALGKHGPPFTLLQYPSLLSSPDSLLISLRTHLPEAILIGPSTFPKWSMRWMYLGQEPTSRVNRWQDREQEERAAWLSPAHCESLKKSLFFALSASR